AVVRSQACQRRRSPPLPDRRRTRSSGWRAGWRCRTASPPRARGWTSCVRRRGARSRAEIRRCRAVATPDRFGFHLAQAVGVALQWSWLKVLFIVPLRHDQPVRSHDRVPMAGEEEYGPPQRHPRPKGRYDTLSLFSKIHSPEKNLMIPDPLGRYRAL